MSRHWKEPYLREKAIEIGIKELEGCVVTCWDEQGRDYANYSRFRAPEQIFYVEVCGFTFAFYSMHMMKLYLEFYSQKILPSRCRDTPHVNHDLRQTEFMRLPLYLREEPKRLKVIKALTKAMADFQKQGA